MRYVVGIDEVGRGSLAGPVVVAAVIMLKGVRCPRIAERSPLQGRQVSRQRRGSPKAAGVRCSKLRDSKKLTAKQRELWFECFKQHPRVEYSIARVYPRQIEKRNISRAANLAALRAFRRLAANHKLQITNHKVFLDGGLFLGNSEQPKNSRTVTKGDERFSCIKIASIIAKVSRDSGMVRLAKKYPQYGFEVHKGYGTRKHIRAVKKHGPSKVHRLTFLKKYSNIRKVVGGR